MQSTTRNHTKKKRIISFILVGILSIGIILLFWEYLAGGIPNSRRDADNFQRNKDIQYIGQLLEKHLEINGAYPCMTTNDVKACSWEEELLKVSGGSPIPRDPQTYEEYRYLTNGANSIIAAEAERYRGACLKNSDDDKLWVFYKTANKKMLEFCTDKLEKLDKMLWSPSY